MTAMKESYERQIADLKAALTPAHSAELLECYDRIQHDPEVVTLMDSFGVENSEDLKELEREDILQLAAPLKKVLRNKLLRVLGFS